MSDFLFYLQLGLQHILDPNGYDHILFIIALCSIYTFWQWKKVAWLVTAFTLGHSITLALATLHILVIKSDVVEFLIPITILLTCIFNFGFKSESKVQTSYQRYIIAACFGLIHGLGFSNFLRSILGKSPNIFMPLLAFNIGLEIGQLLIVLTILLVGMVGSNIFRIKQRDWVLVISGIVAGVALTIVQKNWLF